MVQGALRTTSKTESVHLHDVMNDGESARPLDEAPLPLPSFFQPFMPCFLSILRQRESVFFIRNVQTFLVDNPGGCLLGDEAKIHGSTILSK